MNIYVVTDDRNKFLDFGWYRFADVEEVLTYFEDHQWIGVDLETTTMSPFTGYPFSLQLGDPRKAYVIDLETIDIQRFKQLLEISNLIFQNGVFDLPFLFKEKIIPKYIYDTLVAEKVLSLGILSIDRDLGALTKRYLDIEMDKDYRKYISKGFIEERGVLYAGADVIHLHQIKAAQEKLIQSRKLQDKLDLENKFVHPAAYLEYSGIYLNRDKWMKRVRKIEYEEYGAMLALNEYVKTHYAEFIDAEAEEPLNWNSPAQVQELFRQIGIDIIDPKTKKATVNEHVVARQKDKWDIIKLYIDYKHKTKAVTTYGRNWFDYIMPDGRIHTKFNTLVSTGRTSSGNVRMGPFPNIQNVNKSDYDRNCFEGQKANVLIAYDFSGQESVILADRSQEPRLLEFYQKGLADLHWFVAQQIWPELQGQDYNEEDKNHKEKRQSAKQANFAVAYGGNGITIASNLNVSEDVGWRVYNAYMEAFPDLAKYFDEQAKLAMNRGYVLINDVIKGRRYVSGYRDFIIEYNDRDFWKKYRFEKKRDSKLYKEELYPKCRRLMSKKSEIKKMALNTPCQGTGADMSKEAGIKLFEWILNKKLFGKVKMVNFVHDEWVLEANKRTAEKLAVEGQQIMEDCANRYLNLLTMGAEPKISKHWTK